MRTTRNISFFEFMRAIAATCLEANGMAEKVSPHGRRARGDERLDDVHDWVRREERYANSMLVDVLIIESWSVPRRYLKPGCVQAGGLETCSTRVANIVHGMRIPHDDYSPPMVHGTVTSLLLMMNILATDSKCMLPHGLRVDMKFMTTGTLRVHPWLRNDEACLR